MDFAIWYRVHETTNCFIALCRQQIVETVRSEMIHEAIGGVFIRTDLKRQRQIDIHHDIITCWDRAHGAVVRDGGFRYDVRDATIEGFYKEFHALDDSCLPMIAGPEPDQTSRTESYVFMPFLVQYEYTGRDIHKGLKGSSEIFWNQNNRNPSIGRAFIKHGRRYNIINTLH